MTKEEKNYFDNILDTFTGVDGGIKFIKLRTFLDEMSIRKKNGDKVAEEIMEFIFKFSKMIDIVIQIDDKTT